MLWLVTHSATLQLLDHSESSRVVVQSVGLGSWSWWHGIDSGDGSPSWMLHPRERLRRWCDWRV